MSNLESLDQSSTSQDVFLNANFGVIGRTVSTKNAPNTSREFQFWVADRKDNKIGLEIGNIVAALADDESDITFGAVIEMRSYSDVESYIADFLSHDFGNADISVPTNVSQVIVGHMCSDAQFDQSNQTR